MTFERKPVLMNGAFGAGRHYFVALLAEMLGSGAKLVDGLPRNGESVDAGVIRHNHVMVGRWPFHLPLEHFAVYLDDPKFAHYGHVLFIRDLRDLLISAWNFRVSYGGAAPSPEMHALLQGYAKELQAFPSNEESVLAFMEHGERYGFMPFKAFVEGILYFYNHPRVRVFSYEAVVANAVLELRSFCAQFGYPFSTEAARHAVDTVKRTGRLYRWVPFFTERIEARFKQIAGAALVELGYTANTNWSFQDYRRAYEGDDPSRYVPETARNAQYVDKWLIEAGYRIFYEREVESEQTLRYHLNRYGGRPVGDLRRGFLRSDEYKVRFGERDAPRE